MGRAASGSQSGTDCRAEAGHNGPLASGFILGGTALTVAHVYEGEASVRWPGSESKLGFARLTTCPHFPASTRHDVNHFEVVNGPNIGGVLSSATFAYSLLGLPTRESY